MSSELKNLHTSLVENMSTAKSYMFENLETDAYCFKVIDGDTIKCIIKYNNEYLKIIVRLSGIDTPEKNGPYKDLALKATDFTKKTIENKIVKLRFIKSDKYGRHLCLVFFDEKNINESLIQGGLATSYDGGTKNLNSFIELSEANYTNE